MSGVPRSLISLIEAGRLIPTPEQAAALLRVYEDHRIPEAAQELAARVPVE